MSESAGFQNVWCFFKYLYWRNRRLSNKFKLRYCSFGWKLHSQGQVSRDDVQAQPNFHLKSKLPPAVEPMKSKLHQFGANNITVNQERTPCEFALLTCCVSSRALLSQCTKSRITLRSFSYIQNAKRMQKYLIIGYWRKTKYMIDLSRRNESKLYIDTSDLYPLVLRRLSEIVSATISLRLFLRVQTRQIQGICWVHMGCFFFISKICALSIMSDNICSHTSRQTVSRSLHTHWKDNDHKKAVLGQYRKFIENPTRNINGKQKGTPYIFPHYT